MESSCAICHAREDEKTLLKCPICFKIFCEECGIMKSGKRFCSQFCAEYFYHEGEDDL